MAKLVNVKNRFPTEDPMLEISAGSIPGFSGVNKFGRNDDIDAEQTETIWTGGGIWARPTQARIHQIVSTDANDTLAGSGAKRVAIEGLTDWLTPDAATIEIVELNGLTPVPTANEWVIIHRMRVVEGTANVGLLTATADVDATVTAEIPAGEGQSGMAIFGIPAGVVAYITNWWCSIRRQANSAFDANLILEDRTGLVLQKHYVGGHSQGDTTAKHSFQPYAAYNGPVIISVQASPTTANSELTAGFDLILQNRSDSIPQGN